MWDWVLILSLLVAGLIFLIIEILFVPGTTLVGLFGFAFAVTAIFSAYQIFGKGTGHYVLAGSLCSFAITSYFAFKSGLWLRFAHKTVNKGKVNEGLLSEIVTGMEGRAVSDLKPVGKAELGKKIYEVTTEKSWINSGREIRVVRINHNRIFVEPLN